jgi:hypothetical protein
MAEQYRRDLYADADADFDEASDLSMIPIVGQGMASGKTGKGRQKLGRIAEDLIADVALPTFSDQNYGEFTSIGDYSPEAASYQTISEDPRTRDFQMQALARMQKYADQSADSAEALGRYNAVTDANAVAAQREAGIRNQMAMRGQGGAGMEFVLQQQAAQAGANRAQAGGLNAAQQAALQRLQGTQGVMQGASNVRGMDANVASQNADIINRFNMYNTGARNDAQRMNLQSRQGIANANVQQRDKSLDRRDRTAQMGFGNAMNKASSRGNALQGMSNAAGQSQVAGANAQNQGWQQGKDLVAGIAGLFSGEDE